ncbi:MAG: hypothetical protein K2X43_12060 [Hyphomonadaceae bacterium]|nr:hypothetical protein [Hyphomonadaceae bacterium]
MAAYTQYSQEAAEQTPVFTVHLPQRHADPVPPAAPPAPPPPQRATATPGDRASLARELQRELKRVGCYSGEVNGVWTTSSRMAMKSFTDHVNATLPIDNPDYVLLSLVQGHQERACGAPCPAGQAATESGRCMPSAVLAKTPASPAPEAKGEPSAEKSATTTTAVVPAAAAAALAATAAAPRGEPRAAAPEDRARPAAPAPPANTDRALRSGRSERSARQSGPTPSTGVYERRSRRASNSSKPPKVVRNLLRAFGIN